MAEVADAAELLLANAGTKSKTTHGRTWPRRITGNADARTRSVVGISAMLAAS
jgi:hypothetical protein